MSAPFVKEKFSHQVVLFSLLFLWGCASPWTWQHPDGLGEQELQNAVQECQKIARDEVNRFDYYTPYPAPPYFPLHDRFRHYNPYWDTYPPPLYYDSQRKFIDEERFFRICMFAKGWRQTPTSESQ